jgi:N-acetylmuramoyl-L-alanine amidase
MSFKPTHISIHTAAAASKGKPVDQSAAVIRAYHVNTKGWKDIGYNEVVRMSGRREAGRPWNQAPACIEGFNSHCAGICLSGHGDLMAPPPEQWKSAVEVAVEMLRYYDLEDEFRKNPMRIIGHREINDLIEAGVADCPRTYKTCPGVKFDMSKFRRDVLAALG